MKINKEQENSAPQGFSLVELIVVIIIVFLLAALVIPSGCSSRGSARRTQCRNNLRRIALGVGHYEDKFRIFPPAVILGNGSTVAKGCKSGAQRNGGFSWRLLILPDVDKEERTLYDQVDFNGTVGTFTCAGKNGNPSANVLLLRKQIDVYLCPDDSTQANIDNGYFGTSYAAMISSRPDYTYTEDESHAFQSTKKHIGVLHPQKPAKQRDVARDGSSHTILLVEVSREKKLIERGSSRKSEHYRCGRWFNSQGCLADAGRTPNDFGTKQDEASIDNPVVWGTFRGRKTNGWGRAVSSVHKGGAHVALLDGSVRFITNDVNLKLYKATCTRDGREGVTIDY